MEFIELKSVGSLVTNLGDVHPTASIDSQITDDGVSIFEVCDEWIENLSRNDMIRLIMFLDNHIGWTPDSQIHGGYEEWRTNTWSHWEDVNNEYMNLNAPCWGVS